MLIEFKDYLTPDNIYFWSNLGILPFWLMLIFIPNSKFTQILVNSVIIPLILATAYIYVFYQTILLDESFLEIFTIYSKLENLYTVFATESFLLIFWLHFLALNIFLGSWVSRDGIKYNMPRIILSTILIIIFFTGPLGLVMHWIVRIFYARKFGFHD